MNVYKRIPLIGYRFRTKDLRWIDMRSAQGIQSGGFVRHAHSR